MIESVISGAEAYLYAGEAAVFWITNSIATAPLFRSASSGMLAYQFLRTLDSAA